MVHLDWVIMVWIKKTNRTIVASL